MAKVFFFSLLFLISANGFSMVWYQGSVVLSNKQVIVGEISRPSDDLILVRSNNEISVLPAHKVVSYRFFDAVENINRQFLAMRIQAGPHHFFERVIVEGVMQVLRRQKQFQETMTETSGAEYDYYTLYFGELYSLRYFRQLYYASIRKALRHNQDALKLDPNVQAEAIRLIQLFNRLEPATPIAGI